MHDARPVWIFDLDDTLHDASARIFPCLNEAMTDYVQRHLRMHRLEADRLRMEYWRRYGATLLGLMRHHGTPPAHFLRHTHPLPELLPLLEAHPRLARALHRLPGRKLVFSNGPQHYAEAVIAALGLRNCFDRVVGIEHADYQPKPRTIGFLKLLQRERLEPSRCIMVEDSLENLRTAKKLGMRTLWVHSMARKPAFVDRRVSSIDQLASLLSRLHR